MFEKLDELLNALEKDDVETPSFCREFVKVLELCLSTPGLTLAGQLAIYSWGINIYTRARPKLQNIEEVNNMSRTLFQSCARAILNEKFQTMVGVPALENFIEAVNEACISLSRDGYAHRFLMLQYLLRQPWDNPVLLAIMMGEPIEKETALSYIETGEFPELFHLRVQMLMQSGCEDFALNLCNWCTQAEKFQYDPYIRGVQLVLLFDRGFLDIMNEECKSISCCIGKEIVHCLQEDYGRSDACLELSQTFLVRDWLRPNKYCCTKDLLFHWLIARRRVDFEEKDFIFNVGKLLETSSSTWQLMALVDVMHQLFGKEFMQFCTEVCVLGIVTEMHNMDLARQNGNAEQIKSAKGSLTFTCSILSCLASDCCINLRRLSMLTALTLEPKRDIYDSLVKIYSVTPQEQLTKKDGDNNEITNDKEGGSAPEKTGTDKKAASSGKEKVKQFLEIPGVSSTTANTVYLMLNKLKSEKLNPELSWNELRMPCFKLVLAEEAQQNATQAKKAGVNSPEKMHKTPLKNGVISGGFPRRKSILDLKAYRQSVKLSQEGLVLEKAQAANANRPLPVATTLQKKIAHTKPTEEILKQQAIRTANERIYNETKKHGVEFSFLKSGLNDHQGSSPASKVQTPVQIHRLSHIPAAQSKGQTQPKPSQPTLVIDATTFKPVQGPSVIHHKSGGTSTICRPAAISYTSPNTAVPLQATAAVNQGLIPQVKDNQKSVVVKSITTSRLPSNTLSQFSQQAPHKTLLSVMPAAVGAPIIHTGRRPTPQQPLPPAEPSHPGQKLPCQSLRPIMPTAQNKPAVLSHPTSTLQTVQLAAPQSKIRMIYHTNSQRAKSPLVAGVHPVATHNKKPGVSLLNSNHLASTIRQQQNQRSVQGGTVFVQGQAQNVSSDTSAPLTAVPNLSLKRPQSQTQLQQLQQELQRQQQQQDEATYHQLLTQSGPPKPSRRVSAKFVLPAGEHLPQANLPQGVKMARVQDQMPQSLLGSDAPHPVSDVLQTSQQSPQAIAISGDMDVNLIIKGLMGPNSKSFAQVTDPKRKFFKTRTVALTPSSLQDMLTDKNTTVQSRGGALGNVPSETSLSSQVMSGQQFPYTSTVHTVNATSEQILNRSLGDPELLMSANTRDRNIFTDLTPNSSPVAKTVERTYSEVNIDGLSVDTSRIDQASCEIIAGSDIQCDVTQEQVIGSEDGMFSDYSPVQTATTTSMVDSAITFGGPGNAHSFDHSLHNNGLNDLPPNMMRDTSQLPPINSSLLSPRFGSPTNPAEQGVYDNHAATSISSYGSAQASSMPFIPGALTGSLQNNTMPVQNQTDIPQDFCQTTLLPTGPIDTEPGQPSVGKNQLGDGADTLSSPGSKLPPAEDASGKYPEATETASTTADSITPGEHSSPPEGSAQLPSSLSNPGTENSSVDITESPHMNIPGNRSDEENELGDETNKNNVLNEEGNENASQSTAADLVLIKETVTHLDQNTVEHAVFRECCEVAQGGITQEDNGDNGGELPSKSTDHNETGTSRPESASEEDVSNNPQSVDTLSSSENLSKTTDAVLESVHVTETVTAALSNEDDLKSQVTTETEPIEIERSQGMACDSDHIDLIQKEYVPNSDSQINCTRDGTESLTYLPSGDNLTVFSHVPSDSDSPPLLDKFTSGANSPPQDTNDQDDSQSNSDTMPILDVESIKSKSPAYSAGEPPPLLDIQGNIVQMDSIDYEVPGAEVEGPVYDETFQGEPTVGNYQESEKPDISAAACDNPLVQIKRTPDDENGVEIHVTHPEEPSHDDESSSRTENGNEDGGNKQDSSGPDGLALNDSMISLLGPVQSENPLSAAKPRTLLEPSNDFVPVDCTKSHLIVTENITTSENPLSLENFPTDTDMTITDKSFPVGDVESGDKNSFFKNGDSSGTASEPTVLLSDNSLPIGDVETSYVNSLSKNGSNDSSGHMEPKVDSNAVGIEKDQYSEIAGPAHESCLNLQTTHSEGARDLNETVSRPGEITLLPAQTTGDCMVDDASQTDDTDSEDSSLVKTRGHQCELDAQDGAITTENQPQVNDEYSSSKALLTEHTPDAHEYQHVEAVVSEGHSKVDITHENSVVDNDEYNEGVHIQYDISKVVLSEHLPDVKDKYSETAVSEHHADIEVKHESPKVVFSYHQSDVGLDGNHTYSKIQPSDADVETMSLGAVDPERHADVNVTHDSLKNVPFEHHEEVDIRYDSLNATISEHPPEPDFEKETSVAVVNEHDSEVEHDFSKVVHSECQSGVDIVAAGSGHHLEDDGSHIHPEAALSEKSDTDDKTESSIVADREHRADVNVKLDSSTDVLSEHQSDVENESSVVEVTGNRSEVIKHDFSNALLPEHQSAVEIENRSTITVVPEIHAYQDSSRDDPAEQQSDDPSKSVADELMAAVGVKNESFSTLNSEHHSETDIAHNPAEFVDSEHTSGVDIKRKSPSAEDSGNQFNVDVTNKSSTSVYSEIHPEVDVNKHESLTPAVAKRESEVNWVEHEPIMTAAVKDQPEDISVKGDTHKDGKSTPVQPLEFTSVDTHEDTNPLLSEANDERKMDLFRPEPIDDKLPEMDKPKDSLIEWVYADSDEEISFHISNDNEDLHERTDNECKEESPKTTCTESPTPKTAANSSLVTRRVSTSPSLVKPRSPKAHGTWTGYKWVFSTDKGQSSTSPKAQSLSPLAKIVPYSHKPQVLQKRSPQAKSKVSPQAKIQHPYFTPIRKITPPSESAPKSYIVKIIPDSFEVRVSPHELDDTVEKAPAKRKITPPIIPYVADQNEQPTKRKKPGKDVEDLVEPHQQSRPVTPVTTDQNNEVATKRKSERDAKNVEPLRKSRRPSTQRDSTATASLYKLTCAKRKNSSESFSDSSPLSSPRRPELESLEKKTSPDSPPHKEVLPQQTEKRDARKRKVSVESSQSELSQDEMPRPKKKCEFTNSFDDGDRVFSDGSSVEDDSAAQKLILKRLQNSPGFVPEVVEGKTRFGFLRHPERDEKPRSRLAKFKGAQDETLSVGQVQLVGRLADSVDPKENKPQTVSTKPSPSSTKCDSKPLTVSHKPSPNSTKCDSKPQTISHKSSPKSSKCDSKPQTSSHKPSPMSSKCETKPTQDGDKSSSQKPKPSVKGTKESKKSVRPCSKKMGDTGKTPAKNEQGRETSTKAQSSCKSNKGTSQNKCESSKKGPSKINVKTKASGQDETVKSDGSKSRLKAEKTTTSKTSKATPRAKVDNEKNSAKKETMTNQGDKRSSMSKLNIKTPNITPMKSEGPKSGTILLTLPWLGREQADKPGNPSNKCDCHKMPSKYKCWNPDCARSAQVMNGPLSPVGLGTPNKKGQVSHSNKVKTTGPSHFSESDSVVNSKNCHTNRTPDPGMNSDNRKRPVYQVKSNEAAKTPRGQAVFAGQKRVASRTEEGACLNISFAQIKEKFTLTKLSNVVATTQKPKELKVQTQSDKLQSHTDDSDVEPDWTKEVQNPVRFKHIKTYSRTQRSKPKTP